MERYKWDIITDNVINTGKVLNDLLDTETSKEITWHVRNADGTLSEKKVKNVAKIHEEVNNITNFATKEEFEALAEIRRQYYAGSGVVKYGNIFSGLNDKKLIDLWNHSIKGCCYFKNFTNNYNKWMYYGRTAKVLHWSREGWSYVNIANEINLNPKINVNGYLITIRGINQSKAFESCVKNVIEFPEERLPVIEKDSSKLSRDYKQGDWIYLTDTERELVTNGTFDNGIDGWEAYGLDIEYDSENKRLKITTNNGDYEYVEISVKTIKDVAYKISCDYDDNGTGVPIEITGPDYGNIHETEYIAKSKGFDKIRFVFRNRDNKTVYIDNVSLKLAEPAKLVVTNDIPAGSDIFKNAWKFLTIDSFSRQDLVFLETWHEDVTEKDVVYPYGNVQYRGNNIDDLNGISNTTWFDGHETYSLFGNWQNPGDLIGKGYRWSKLSEEDKTKLANNPEHNLYKDGDKIIQVRYRIRVVKGLGNRGVVDTQNPGTYGLLYYSGRVAVKGKYTLTADLYDYRNGLPAPRNKYINSASGYNEYPTKQNGEYGADRYDPNIKEIAIPIALVQRRNPGIFHTVYNPEGCALVYDSGAKKWFEAKDDDGNLLIKSVEDCFNHDYIAVVNKDDHSDAAKLSELEDGSISADKYKKTGYIESMMSGRPDGFFVDEVNERDVDDLRIDANPIEDYNQFLESEFIKVIRGEVRGKENKTSIKLKQFWLSDHDREYTGRRGIFIYSDKKNGTRTYLDRIDVVLGDGVMRNGVYRKFFLYWTDKDGNIIGGDVVEETAWCDQLHSYVKNPNAYGFKVFVADGTYTQNNTYLQCDIIGDPRKLKDRVEIDVNDDKTVNIRKGMYLKCSDNSKNNGKKGHYYLALKDIDSIHTNSDDGDANANNGHIDFSNDDVWTDLGDNGNLGGYPDEWLEHGIYGSPLLVGENGEDLTPIRGWFNGEIDIRSSDVGYYSSFRGVYFKLSKKGKKIKEVIAIGRDGKYVKYNQGAWNEDLSAGGGRNNFEIDYKNHIYINIGNDKTLDALGFDNVKEALVEVIFLVYYESYANFLEVTNNSNITYADSDVTISSYTNYYYGGPVVYNCLNKVSIGDIAGNTAGKINGKTLHNNWQTNNYHILWHMPFKVDAHYTTYVSKLSPTAKFFSYLTEKNNRAQVNIVFKELKWDPETKNWGDDNKFQITDKVGVITDTNGKHVLYGQKAFKTNRFIKKS